MQTHKIAIVCNYQLRSDRIGGMDRFFKAFDSKAKEAGYAVDWYFKSYNGFDFYKNLNIISSEGKPIEAFTLNQIQGNQLNYQFIITHFTELCTPFYKNLKKLTGAYIIAVDHNPRPLLGFPLKKRLKNKIKGLLFGSFINQFVGVSQYTVDFILKDYGHHLKFKTKVIYNGIDTQVFKKRIQPNNNKFIVASHLRHSKGIQDLLEALVLLDENNRQAIKIDIYGEGPMEKELKHLTQSLKLEKIIFFHGSCSSLNELFCNYSFMLQPTYMECFSLSILESLSANVPVVTTPVGGNLEVIKHGINGFIYPAGDVEALATLLNQIINGELIINRDVSELVEQQFYLSKMVREHFDLVSCT